jgi:hypothetical protein
MTATRPITGFCVACFLVVQGISVDARCESSPVDRAAELFQRGREAMKRSEHAAACEAFAASQALDPSPGTLLNLAVCEERLGHLLRARDFAREFIRSAPPVDDRGPRAVALAAHLDERIPTLTIDAPTDTPAEAQLLLDDNELPREKWHTAVPVEPGEHVVVLRRPGLAEWRVQLTIAEGEKLTTTPIPKPRVAAQETIVPIAATRNVDAPPSSQLPTAFWTSAAVGGVGLGVAALSGILVLSNRSVVDDHCAQKRCDAEGLAAGERGALWSTVNTVALPVGLIGTAFATYFFLSSPKTGPAYSFRMGVNAHGSTIIVGREF